MAILFSCQCFSMFCKYFQHIFLEVPSQSFNQFRYLSHIFCLEKRSEAKRSERSEAKRSEADRGGSRNEVGGGEAVWRRAMSCNYTYSHVYNPTYSYNYYNSARKPPVRVEITNISSPSTNINLEMNKRPCESRLRGPNKRPCESRLRTYLVPLQTLILTL